MTSIPITTKLAKPVINKTQASIIKGAEVDNELYNFYQSLDENEKALLKNVPAFNPEAKLLDLNRITKLLNRKSQLTSQGDWLISFKELLKSANESPFKCAEMVGVSWSIVTSTNEELIRNGDSSLNELLITAKKAFAEMIMFHPERYSGNATMAIFMVRSLAGWSDGTVNEFGVPNDKELEAILDARTKLQEERELLDQAYIKGSMREPMRELTAKTA